MQDVTPSHVDAWVRRRTWIASEMDLERIRRRMSSVSIAVVIPALDEIETIGEVVEAVARLRGHGLVDELVVVDGGSRDGTAGSAAAAGATVLDQADAVEGAGPGGGKGDSMWKGLARTQSELVVFIDADLRTFEEGWIVRLVAPMILDEDVALVKALYERSPGADEDESAGGGRVTEILARPLLNAFWPELAGIAQPLGGEYAGRREALEAVPFVMGYGVEFGLLVDVAERFGADAIGQVDVGVRVHDHQPLENLGRMAGEILAVAGDRLASQGRLQADLHPKLLQPERDGHGGVSFARHEVGHQQRPPLASWRARSASTH